MKKVILIYIAVIFLAGCNQASNAESSQTSAVSVDYLATSSLQMTDAEYIKQQEDEYGTKYTPKYEAKFGPFTPWKEEEIKASVPIEENTNKIFKTMYEKYFGGTDKRIVNPVGAVYGDMKLIGRFDREWLSYNMPLLSLAIEFTVLERINTISKDYYPAYSFFKVRVEKAFSCDLKQGDEVIIKQEGTEKVGVYTGSQFINYKQFVSGQRITALSFKPKKEVLNEQSVNIYYMNYNYVLYHETIDGVDYVLDMLDQNVVEAAYFFKKVKNSSDAFKVSYWQENDQKKYVGIIKADVLDEVIKELI